MTGPGPVQGGARQRLERILARIEAAARRAGRDPSGVTLVGVTKTVPPNRIVEAVRAGLSHLGENRLQEAETKVSAEGLAGLPLTWHLVGHLQSNKAKRAAELFSWVHSIDSVDLARRLGRLAAGRAVPLKVLIQVDLGHEPTKHGVDVSQLEELARETAGQKPLELRGLMT
ncbi:MAG TPA: YggS family pyridoxal phosphate-dependent enzyme, partial [Candidatus Polarisedimenticolia bacterium]|nr:YggS family pyridoxal phosphate-dependent enzyme [Candidatus Polarisedimenticolia bacterium]